MKNKSDDDDEESSGNKRKRVQFEDNQQNSADEADKSQDKKRYKEDCLLHPRRDGKCGHTFGDCTANPDTENKNFCLTACKKVLGQRNIAEKFPWYVKMCEEHRGLTVEDGIPSDRSNRKS